VHAVLEPAPRLHAHRGLEFGAVLGVEIGDQRRPLGSDLRPRDD